MRNPLMILALIAVNCFVQTGHSGHWISCEATTAAELAIDHGLALLQPIADDETSQEQTNLSPGE